MADGVNIRMQDLVRELKEVDKKFASSVRKQVRKAVTEAGADITAQMQASARAQGLIRAAAATRMTASFAAKSAGVKVITNRNRAPYAKAYELGNRGGSPGRDWFWHPVFGRRKWIFGIGQVTAKQKKRPFFFPSVVKKTPEMERKFLDAIDQAVRDAGFR